MKENKNHNKENLDNIEESSDMSSTTVTLEDENGESFEFEIIKTFEVDGETYAALVPLKEDEIDLDDEDDLGDDLELVLLKFVYENEEEFLSVIDDDDEYERVLDGLMADMPEDFDIKVE